MHATTAYALAYVTTGRGEDLRSCPKQTGNQRDLFGDIDKLSRALCTDAACFQRKVEAHYLRKAEQALARGHEVLSPEESAQLFAHGSYLVPTSEYVDLDLFHPMDPERRTYRQLLRGQKVPQVLAIDHFHRTHDLVLKTDAEIALASAGHVFLRGGQGTKEDFKQQQREQRKRVAEAREKQLAIVHTVVERTTQQEPDADFWQILVLGLLQGSWHESIKDMVKRRGLFVKGQQPEALLSAHVTQASSDELRGIAFELVVTRGSGPLYFTSVFKAAIRKYANEFAATMPGELEDEDEQEEAGTPEPTSDTAIGPAEPELVMNTDTHQGEQPGDAVEPSSDEPDTTPKAA